MSQTSASEHTRAAHKAVIDPQEILARVRSCLPPSSEPIALHEPHFVGRERDYVNDCIDTSWVSYAGPYVQRFEAALAEYCGTSEAIAVVNGTVALQLAFQLAGILREDEILVPALTFVATANAVVHAGAIPHFIDVEETTLGVDAEALRKYLRATADYRNGVCRNRTTGRRIGGIVPVHIFGHPVNMTPLNQVAGEYGLAVIEDAAEALGSRYQGQRCGSLSPLAALSFNGNKIVTTGGGGAILTSDPSIAERARFLTTTAKRPHRWAFVHDEVGYNFRLPNINAALGLAQLERLDCALAAKRYLWQRYRDAFANLSGARIFEDASFAESNHWLIALILHEPNSERLEAILGALNDAGIRARPAWTPMHMLAMYRQNPCMPVPVAEALAKRIINLPSSPHLAAMV